MKIVGNIILAMMVAVVGCQTSRQGTPNGSEPGPVYRQTPEDARKDVNEYPITVSNLSAVPPGTLDGLTGVMSKIVNWMKGLGLDASATCWAFLCLPDALPWIARVHVLEGPISTYRLGSYGNPGPIEVPLWEETRHYRIRILETFLGEPRQKEYRLWDLGGYCPGDFRYCPDGDVGNVEKCLRIKGEMHPWGTCSYYDPKTGELLVHIMGLDLPSRLEAGAEFVLFGADAIQDITEEGLWTRLKRLDADPGSATLTGAERLLFRTEGDQVDVMYLREEDFPGSPSTYIFSDSRWIPLRILARRILDRIVIPYLQDHPDDKPYVEAALSGLLREEYLSPTPEIREEPEPALTSCPDDAVAFAGSKCKGHFTCHSGKVTCCGEVYSRENCACNKFMSEKDELECVVLNEDRCFGGTCEPQPCMADRDCPPGSRCFPVIMPPPFADVVYMCVPSG